MMYSSMIGLLIQKSMTPKETKELRTKIVERIPSGSTEKFSNSAYLKNL